MKNVMVDITKDFLPADMAWDPPAKKAKKGKKSKLRK